MKFSQVQMAPPRNDSQLRSKNQSKTHRSINGSTDQKLAPKVQMGSGSLLVHLEQLAALPQSAKNVKDSKEERKPSSSFIQVVPKPKQLVITTDELSKQNTSR